jgi:phosphoglycerate dehydrogenase-like enzyme
MSDSGAALKVIFLPQVGTDLLWQEHVVASVDPRHDLRIYDRTAPIAPQFADVDVVIDTGGSVGTREMLDAAHKVRLWQILGTGLDKFDMAYWRDRGVMVANCPGPMSAIALAEHALLLMLMVARRVPESFVGLANGVLYQPLGQELPGRTLCLVGFGASARELAVRAKAMGMRVVATDLEAVDAETMARWGADEVLPADQLDTLLPEADVVSLHLHLNAQTRHTLDARRIALMPAGSMVVNVARGALVDEVALVDAVARGHLAGAGIDVFSVEPPPPDDRLLTTPGIICTPHIAGVTDGTARRRALGAAANVERVAEGLEPLHRVDHL